MQTSTSKRGSRFLISIGDTNKERSCTQDMVGPCLKLEIGLLPGKQKKLGGKKREIYFIYLFISLGYENCTSISGRNILLCSC